MPEKIAHGVSLRPDSAVDCKGGKEITLDDPYLSCKRCNLHLGLGDVGPTTEQVGGHSYSNKPFRIRQNDGGGIRGNHSRNRRMVNTDENTQSIDAPVN